MGEIKLTPGLILAFAIVALAAAYMANPAIFEEILGGEQVSQGYYAPQLGQGVVVSQGEGAGTAVSEVPSYQLSEVNLYVKDKLNPKAGVPNLTVEALEAPTPPYTMADLSRIASDPNRMIIDSNTTDSNGLASFSAGSIFVNKDYIYSIRGDSTTYDKLVVLKIPVPSKEFKIESYTFPDPQYVYYVGSFSDLYTTPEVNASTDSCLNITGKSGVQFCSWDITIAETEAGKAIQNPVIILRIPEGSNLDPSAIRSIYLVRKTGTDFGISPANLAGYIDVAPIDLRGSLYDEDYGVDFMTAADSATYTLKIEYDADLVSSGDQLQIVLDDLGDYRAKDIVTRDTKASAESLTVEWGS